MYKLSALKLYFKYNSSLLPLYFNIMFETRTLTHANNTRNRLAEIPNIPKHKLLEQSVRYYIPILLSKMPSSITDKIDTHSLHGFSSYSKKCLLGTYSESCSVLNCYICMKQ